MRLLRILFLSPIIVLSGALLYAEDNAPGRSARQSAPVTATSPSYPPYRVLVDPNVNRGQAAAWVGAANAAGDLAAAERGAQGPLPLLRQAAGSNKHVTFFGSPVVNITLVSPGVTPLANEALGDASRLMVRNTSPGWVGLANTPQSLSESYVGMLAGPKGQARSPADYLAMIQEQREMHLARVEETFVRHRALAEIAGEERQLASRNKLPEIRKEIQAQNQIIAEAQASLARCKSLRGTGAPCDTATPQKNLQAAKAELHKTPKPLFDRRDPKTAPKGLIAEAEYLEKEFIPSQEKAEAASKAAAERAAGVYRSVRPLSVGLEPKINQAKVRLKNELEARRNGAKGSPGSEKEKPWDPTIDSEIASSKVGGHLHDLGEAEKTIRALSGRDSVQPNFGDISRAITIMTEARFADKVLQHVARLVAEAATETPRPTVLGLQSRIPLTLEKMDLWMGNRAARDLLWNAIKTAATRVGGFSPMSALPVFNPCAFPHMRASSMCGAPADKTIY